MRVALMPIIWASLLLMAGCAERAAEGNVSPDANAQPEASELKIESPSFKEGGTIPEDFSCDGSDISPALVFKEVPKQAKSLALIMDDPDAPSGTFVHWVAWNIPPATIRIKEGEAVKFPQGKNDFGKMRYGGPCPPSGTHRYFFKLYALGTMLTLREGSTKKDLEAAMKGHIIAEAHLMGTYSR